MKQAMAAFAVSVIVSACATSASVEAGGGSSNADETPVYQQPIDYIPSALGPHSWKITTSSEKAQQFFDQGLQMRYAYGMNDAARSFRQAHREDPNCAMCYWGEAFSLGSFLNGGMSAEKAPHAHEAIEKGGGTGG